MIIKSFYCIFFCLILASQFIVAQESNQEEVIDSHWNSTGLLNPYRLVTEKNVQIEYIDLDYDGDPDLLRTLTWNKIPIQWLDDDDDMKEGDVEGDLDSDCLMVDLNKDGDYGSYSDVVIDWVDNNNDNIGDMQIYAEFAEESQKDVPTGPGHYMINIDLDKDNVMNYIDWNTFRLRAWLHDGQADFYEDYSGTNLFLKMHTSPEKINDLRLNWENPFLFYDPDDDKLTEFAIRVIDNPVRGKQGDEYLARPTGKASWISLSYDLDNDNSPENEFDFDMTINFRGEGFDYLDQIHSYPNMKGISEGDKYFMDSRIRNLTELIYPDHESIHDLIFNRGKWSEVYFVYDEDDDCERWERVELYDPKDPYITGKRNGGLDDNPQSDPIGDRGEWDLDNSGYGNLYISNFDGRIHLLGAESGYWRIDQNAYYYQGMGGLYDGYGLDRLSRNVEQPFPLIKYSDTDLNGFFDKIEYDLDGDSIFEESVSIKALSINDSCEVIKLASMNYSALKELENHVATNLWEQAMVAVKVAKREGININWYALLLHPKSIRQKYHFGYWLQFYLYHDLKEYYQRNNLINNESELSKAYYSGKWDRLI